MTHTNAAATWWRDWVHEQLDLTRCGAWADTCPDWPLAHRLAEAEAEHAAADHGTDRDRLVALLADLGVTPEVDDEVERRWLHLRADDANEKVRGYGGFVASFEFTPGGELVSVGLYE